MRTLMVLAAGVSVLLFLSACGDTPAEGAATGGVAGAVVAGPPGAVAGATVGALIK